MLKKGKHFLLQQSTRYIANENYPVKIQRYVSNTFQNMAKSFISTEYHAVNGVYNLEILETYPKFDVFNYLKQVHILPFCVV